MKWSLTKIPMMPNFTHHKENYKDKMTTILYIAIYLSFILPYFGVKKKKNTLDRPWIHITCFQKSLFHSNSHIKIQMRWNEGRDNFFISLTVNIKDRIVNL